MKKSLLIVLILLNFTIANAQRLHLTLFGGISNYAGDLQTKQFTFQQADAAFGFGVLYEIMPKLYARANVTFGKIKGDDKVSGVDLSRNLSFSSPLSDLHLGVEYDLLNSYDRILTPYVFAGISVFHFNPSTLDSTGNKAFLQPLGTEGQGFFMDRQKYSLTTFALPFGGGVKFSLSENVKVRVEAGLRKTFTDYLDDVSSTYADETQLLLNNGARAVDLAFRGDENKGGLVYPPANTKRGSPENMDWYYFTGIGVSFRLSPKYNGSGGSSGNKTGCPVNIY